MSMPAEISSTDQGHAARALIEAAAAQLAERRRDIPATFVGELFGRTASEDLLRYAPDELALLAEEAFGLLASRTKRSHFSGG